MQIFLQPIRATLVLVALTLVLPLAGFPSAAQAEEETDAKKETKRSFDLPTIDLEKIATKLDYDPKRGYGFTSEDGKFELRFNALFQGRGNYVDGLSTTTPDRSTFEVHRGRLGLRGHLFTEKLSFRIEHDFADPFDGWVHYWGNYEFFEELQVRAGHFRIPFNRHELISSGRLQLIERSFINAYPSDTAVYGQEKDRGFGIGFDLGVMVHGEAFDGRLEYNISGTNGKDPSPQSVLVQQDVNQPAGSEPLWAFRLVVNPFGPVPYEGPDLEISETPKVALGTAYYFEKEFQAQSGGALFDVEGAVYEVVFKWQGFSILAEYYTQVWEQEEFTGEVIEAEWQGFIIDGGYLLPVLDRKLEVVGRYAKIKPFDPPPTFGIQDRRINEREFAVGLNYYVNGHNFKLSVNQTWGIIELEAPNPKENRALTTFQMQVML